jgi:type II secretory pathway pseudopilin PulG
MRLTYISYRIRQEVKNNKNQRLSTTQQQYPSTIQQILANKITHVTIRVKNYIIQGLQATDWKFVTYVSEELAVSIFYYPEDSGRKLN